VVDPGRGGELPLLVVELVCEQRARYSCRQAALGDGVK
jgi:hypothetical protein